jgi:hypothetical protein
MKTRADLDPETIFESGGEHLTDVAITALADGQELGHEAGVHVEACEACCARLADAALVGAEVHGGIVALASADETAVASAPAPRRSPAPRQRSLAVARTPNALPYVAVGLVVTLLASLPGLSSALAQVSGARLQAAGLRQAGRVVVFQVSAPLWSVGVAVVLVALGLAVAVWGSRSRSGGTKHGFA